MKKQRYLDAMGIISWSNRDTRISHTVLTDDINTCRQSILVKEVLDLLGYHIEACRFEKKPLSTDKVIWDMRLMNRPHKPNILYSQPLNKLQQEPQNKSALWQQLWQQFDLVGIMKANSPKNMEQKRKQKVEQDEQSQ